MNAPRRSSPAITGRRVRIALVGCGRIAGQHLDAIARHDQQAQLVALCDSNPSAVAAPGVLGTDVPRFTSLESMIDALRGELDLVVLATPSGLHAPQAIAAARAGLHVLTEKPMATRWKDGLAMVRAFEAAGTRLFVVKQTRLEAPLVALKRAVDQGRFGRIAMVSVNVFWTRPQSYYDAAPWRGTWALDGGAFMNQASHYIDMVDWLVGPVAKVHAFAATLARRIEAEDTGVMSLRLASGALASIAVTMLAHERNFEGSITVLGERGTVRVGGAAVNRVEHWAFDEAQPEDAAMRANNDAPPSPDSRGHAGVYAQVLASLHGRASDAVDSAEGLRSLEVLAAAYQSAHEGRVVTLPLGRD